MDLCCQKTPEVAQHIIEYVLKHKYKINKNIKIDYIKNYGAAKDVVVKMGE